MLKLMLLIRTFQKYIFQRGFFKGSVSIKKKAPQDYLIAYWLLNTAILVLNAKKVCNIFF